MGIKDWRGGLKNKVAGTIKEAYRDPKSAVKWALKKGNPAKLVAVPLAIEAEQRFRNTEYISSAEDWLDQKISEGIDITWDLAENNIKSMAPGIPIGINTLRYGAESNIKANVRTFNWVKEKVSDLERIDSCTVHCAATITSKVSCPIHGVGVIITGSNRTTVSGHQLAVYGDVTSCGATLLPPCRSFDIGGLYVACVGDPTSHGGTILTGISSLKIC